MLFLEHVPEFDIGYGYFNRRQVGFYFPRHCLIVFFAGKFKQNQVVFTVRMEALPCVDDRADDLSFLEKGPRQRVVIPEVRLLYFFPQFAKAFFLFVYFKDNLLILQFYCLFPVAGIQDH
jgi:hypothetical protein